MGAARPKVLMVHNRSSWGGNLGVVLALCRGLPARGFDVALAAPADEEYVGRFRAAGVPVFDAAVRHKYDAAAYRRYARLIRGEGISVVHTHTRRADFVAGAAGRAAGRVVVSTQHGQLNLERWTLKPQNNFTARFYAWCLRRFFDRHVAVSAEIAAELRERCHVPAAKVTHIPNGIDAAAFAPAADARRSFRAEVGAARWTVVIAVVGSLDVKGHDDLLAATAAVVAEGVDARLVVVGTGWRGGPAIATRAAALGLTSRIHLLGFRDDVPRILAGSDIFVLPSLSEGLSIAIMEAMAASLPVVATAVGGNGELVAEGRTGFLVPARDARALAAAIGALAREPGLRREMGRAGAARVGWEFTATKMLDRYAALYRELLAARPGGRPA
jgi:glycosyltransferase involved in cell wall biosynthesis